MFAFTPYLRCMYSMLRSVLFLFDAEKVHHFAMQALRLACSVPPARLLLQHCFKAKASPAHLLGLSFRNCIGLAAGFDKNAQFLRELEVLGFGFVEIGTVTPKPQAGNPKPRLFRLPADKALINRMGFNNDGVEALKRRLMHWQAANYASKGRATQTPRMIIGGNIGKNKHTPNAEAWKDYEICFNELYDVVDYFVVNVSSPNTPGLRALQEKEALRKILTHLQLLRTQKSTYKPILLKIAPDLHPQELDDIIALALEIALDGMVAANTTVSREGLRTSQAVIEKIGAGGLSGLPVKERATALVRYIHQQTQGKIPIIASGGIFTGSDAKEKLEAGASLVQVWTGFVYEGPAVVKKILRTLQA